MASLASSQAVLSLLPRGRKCKMPGEFNLDRGSGMPSEEGSARERGGGRAFQTKALPGAGKQSWGAEKKEDHGVCARRGFARPGGLPRNSEARGGVQAITFVFRDMCACPSTCLSPLSPQAPAVSAPASPWRAFTWPRPCSLLHRGPYPEHSSGQVGRGASELALGDQVVPSVSV